MKPLYTFIFLLLLTGCSTPQRDNGHPIAIKTPTADTSFAALLACFKEESFPFTFDSDTSFAVQDSFYYGTGHDVTDAAGVSLSTLLLPRPLLERYLTDSGALKQHSDLVEEIATNPAAYYDSLYWNTAIPFVRFRVPDGHLLLLCVYTQMGATSGGYTVVWVLHYTSAGALTKTIPLGRYGLDSHTKLTDAWWKQTLIYTALRVTMPSARAAMVTERRYSETEVQEYRTENGKSATDTSYVLHRKLGAKRSTLQLNW